MAEYRHPPGCAAHVSDVSQEHRLGRGHDHGPPGGGAQHHTGRVQPPVHGWVQIQQGGRHPHARRDQLGRQEHVGVSCRGMRHCPPQQGQARAPHPEVAHPLRARVLQEVQGQPHYGRPAHLSGGY